MKPASDAPPAVNLVDDPAPVMRSRARRILWVDGGAGLLVGVVVLALHAPLARLYGFPVPFVLFMAAANLAYASYSGTLAVRASRGAPPSRRAVDVLVAANLAWTVACVVLLAVLSSTATAFGVAQLVGEGTFVAVLAVLERRYVRPAARPAA